MLQRLTINLSEIERQALEAVALSELRDLRGQARFILREEFQRRGLLIAETQHESMLVEKLPAEKMKQEGMNVFE